MPKIDGKFMPQGPKLIEFAANAEPWSQYTLENGAILRIRPVVVKVQDHGQYDEQGFPMYQMQIQQMMDVTWPDDILEAAKARATENGK